MPEGSSNMIPKVPPKVTIICVLRTIGLFIISTLCICGLSYLGLYLLIGELPFSEIQPFEEISIPGVWQAEYGTGRIDRLVINADGTFQQTYREPGYEFVSPNNSWYLTRNTAVGIRLYLAGGRFYYHGTKYFHRVYGQSEVYHDTFTRKPLGNFDKELVLAVVHRRFTNLIVLIHMPPAGDPDSIGFPILGLEELIFFRISD